MSLAAAAQTYGFNYVAADQATGLFVAASLYDVTTGTPIYVTQIPLVEIDSVRSPGSYSANFTPAANKVYDIVSMVYLDSGYTTLDPNRAPGCETVQAVTLSGGGGGGSSASSCTLIGIIQGSCSLIGPVKC